MIRTGSLILLAALLAGEGVHALCAGDNEGANASCESRWTPELLGRQISQHDGPNCFNAALAAAGLVDEIRYVDAVEYRFYIENFCQRQTEGAVLPGDLLAFQGRWSPADDRAPTETLHGALILDRHRIFEKTSVNGASTHRNEDGDIPGRYEIKSRRQSPFFIGNGTVRVIERHRCSSKEVIRTQVAWLNAEPLAQELGAIRSEFDAQFKDGRKFDSTKLTERLRDAAKRLAELGGRQASDVYALAIASSLYGAVSIAGREQKSLMSPALRKSLRRFEYARFALSKKIRKNMKQPAIIRIVNQAFDAEADGPEFDRN